MVLYRVVQVVRKRWVAHAMRLRRGDVGAIVGSGSVHGRLISRRAVGLVDGRGGALAGETWSRLSGLARIARMRRDMAGGSTTSVSGEAALTLLDLALDAATIRSLTDRWQDGAHDLDEVQAQGRWSELERSLNDVVAVRVAHKLLELLYIDKKLLDQHLLGRHLGTTDALLDDVGAELLFRKLDNLAPKARAHGRSEGDVIQVQNVLYDVVTERILDEMETMRSDLADEVDLLKARCVVNAALENTAPVAMSTDSDAVLAYSIEDELGLGRLEVIQALLNDVVAVQVLNEVHNLARQGLDDHLSLRTC
jgi:hypothetical protein